MTGVSASASASQSANTLAPGSKRTTGSAAAGAVPRGSGRGGLPRAESLERRDNAPNTPADVRCTLCGLQSCVRV
ncbi:MAG: hypothetical protein NVSMB2_11960 [Chloroflexota bacterium]